MSAVTFDVYKLNFQSPLVLSTGREEDYTDTHTHLGSDALKSALLACGFRAGIFPATDDPNGDLFLSRFKISSAFPFKGNTLFFPKPFVRLPFQFSKTKDSKARNDKLLKKIVYLDEYYFREALNGVSSLSIPDTHAINGGKFLTKSDKLLKSENQTVFLSEIQQRSRTPKLGEEVDVVPYLIERVHFGENAGLYFLVEYVEQTEDQKAETIRQLEASLRLLGDSGLGSDRTAGNGLFVYEKTKPISFETSKDSNGFVTLSLFCPTKGELEANEKKLENSAFELIKRGGWIASPKNNDHLSWRKKSVYMFKEGGVFTFQPQGRCSDLRPDNFPHPIWRDGRPISIPISFNSNF